MNTIRYNNYHKHDHISNLYTPDTNTKAEEYIKKCVEYGHTNYFTTNHGSMGDIFEARTLCNKYGLRCIAGLEGYIVPNPLEKDNRNYHIIIIPRTDIARKKINVISSRANIEGFYYKPRLFLEDLLKLDKDDIYITSACVAGLLKDEDSQELILKPLIKYFEDNFLLEVQSHYQDIQKVINKKALEYHKEYGLKLIAANDSHYIDEAGQKERLELLKGKHITYDEEDSFILDFPTAETMFDRFQNQGVLTEQQIEDAISNTLIFDDCEEIQLDTEIKMPTIYPELTPKQRVKLLKETINKKFKDIRIQDNITSEEFPKYKAGINYEMKIIEDTNEEIHTADYFLFNTKMVDLAVNKYGGVLTRGGRGSCASFYINRILGMTQLDRFRINLPIFPDRFASTARLLENRALPDIDYNVKEQEPFIKASRELLGEHGCYPMYAPNTMQLSEAFRNVCRSKNLEYDKFNEVAKHIEDYDISDPEWGNIIEEANKYVGTIVAGSIHPCAHLLSDKNILEEYGVIRLGENICVLITSAEADEYKVLKNDYLIVSVWSLIDETFKLIGRPIIPARELLESIKDDDRVWDLFAKGLTCTLNQVDSDNGMQQAKKYGIKSFEQGAYIAAAIRPSFDSWRDMFLNHEEYSTGSDKLDEVLSMTNHYILYQENLMQYFEWLGVSPAESIGLIKKISKKKIKQEDFDNLEERIKAEWIIKTGSENMFKETWEMIQSCISYGFCSSHAAATSLDMCYGAYLKVNYPLEYYTVCFNSYSGDLEKTAKLKKELEYFNISLGGIRFGFSHAKYSFDKESRTIYKGVQSIKFLSSDISEELYKLSTQKDYTDFLTLLIDIKKGTSCSSRHLNILICLNFFKEFGDINYLLKIVELYEKIYGKKQFKKDKLEELNIPENIIKDISQKETPKMYSEVDTVKLLTILIQNINVKKANILQRIQYQQEYLGYIEEIVNNVNGDYYYIQDIKGNYITGYQLNSGKIVKMKTRKKYFEENPFTINKIIKALKFNTENRWKKDSYGKWYRGAETEEILISWIILKDKN